LETLFHTQFFDIIAVNFNALFQSFYPLCKTFGTFLCREVLEKFFHTLLNFLIVCKALSSKVIFEFGEQVEVTWGQVRAVGGVGDIIPAKFGDQGRGFA